MKKLLSILLTLSLVFALFAGMTGTASAEDYYGDKYYAWDNGDGTCTISYYYEYSDATEIYVPKYVNGMRVAALAAWCFDGFYQLETLILPEHLSYIGSYAFAGCENLKSIRIPASVTALDPEAFSGSSLNDIHVSSSNRTFCSVDGVVFSKDKRTLFNYPPAKEAENYTVPSGVKRIGDFAFRNAWYLTSVKIPDGVVSIGDSAFCYCYGLASVNLPDSLTECGSWIFEECVSLQNVTIPKGMTAIPPYMFYSCGLSSISIPNNIVSIGEGAFEGCWNLTSVNIPDSVVSIGDYAFLGYYGENGIRFVLSPNVSNIGIQALSSASSITVSSENPYFASENGVLFSKDMTKLIQYPPRATTRSYAIPSTVTEIAEVAFMGAFNLQSVSMPDSVVSIGEAAFYNSAITSIVIPQGVQKIPASAFTECYNLARVLLPDNLTAIGTDAFASCYGLQNISLPDSVQTLGEGAFCWCESLTKMEIPFGVTQINGSLFYGCTSLTSLVLPSSIKEIYPWAFGGCNALSSIEFTGTKKQWDAMFIYNDWDEPSILETIPVTFTGTNYYDDLFNYVKDGKCGKIMINSLTDTGSRRSLLEIPAELNGKPIELIGSYAFSESSVREAVIPEGIKVLGSDVFNYCYVLKKVTLPSTLTSIGEGAFYHCEALQSITIPEGITELPQALFCECYNLEDVTLPESLTSMRYSVFYNCYNLESINLPDQLTNIEEYTFAFCERLTSVDFPENLETIGYEAFWGCTALESVTLPDGINIISDWAFDECRNLNWIYIPESLSYLGYNVFWGCENLKSIFYEGSHTQWKAIENRENALYDCNATVYYDCNPVVGSFMDVKASDWFKDAVAYAYENELMNGTSDMLFNPSGSLTRGQLVTILYRVAGEPAIEAPADFSDVPTGKYFSNAVAWAAENGIVNGYNDGTFKPDNKITREQIATILYRYKNPPEVAGTLDFPDAEKVGTYARDAMTWAVSEGLITGIKSNGVTTLAPKNTATRAQIATIIMRYLEA